MAAKAWVLLAALCLLAACDKDQSTVMQQWVGRSDAQMMSQWGAPDHEARATDGSRILTYYGRDPDNRNRIQCNRTFTVNTAGIITNHSDDCPPGWWQATK